jgi:hypothetical protein
LKAIGSAAIIPAAMRLGRVDYVYDIYVTNLLAGIPTSASVQALLSYLTTKRTLEDFEADALADLGHSAALAFLRDRYDWTENIGLCIALYKLAALNGYDGPEFETWQAAAQTFYTTYLQDWSD